MLLLVGAATAVFAEGVLETVDKEVASAYEKSKDAIVKVHAQRQLQLGGLPLVPSLRIGTGFFIDEAGHVLTTTTIVGDSDNCWIGWREQKFAARVLGRDPQANVALLKIESDRGSRTPFLPLGNSDDLRVGSLVIAIGFPFDMPSAPVVGFVGGMDIQRCGRVFVTSHIRAGCRLSPGQGGGPLLNTRGEVVGMAVAAHADDQCYALPINAAHKIWTDIQKFGEAQHPWVGLGISERQLTSNAALSNQWQVFVKQVYSNTPAAAAKFHDGDVIVRITTNDVRRSADVLNTMFYYRAGDEVRFTVMRDGGERALSLIVAARPAEETSTVQALPQLDPLRPVVVPASQDR